MVGMLALTDADAATFTVTNTSDSGAGSLRDAINAANLAGGNDTIVFQAGVAGTIPLSSELLIRSNLTIVGPGASIVNVRRSVGALFRIFNILDFAGGATGGLVVNISGLTISEGDVDSASFPGNSGGGIFNERHCTLTLAECIIAYNRAFNRGQSVGSGGGGIYNGGVLTLIRCTVSRNSVDREWFASSVSGGGISNVGTLTVVESTIYYNEGFEGGGILNRGDISILNSTLEGNFGQGAGGGIYLEAGSATIRNSTFANNSNSHGGAIAKSLFADTEVVGCTFFKNLASKDGGASIYVEGGDLLLANSILFNNSTASFSIANLVAVNGTISSGGYNLCDEDGSGFLNAATDLPNTAPLLDTFGLQDNGGPTRTVALLSGSPALDKGNRFGLATDQRQFARPFDNPALPNAAGGDGSDIGAYEAREGLQGGATLVVTTTDDHDDGVCGPLDCTLREAIHRANTVLAVDRITFAPGVTGVITLLGAHGGPLTITDVVTITGPGARSLALTSNTQSRLLSITGGTSVISGLTLRDGFVAGGAPGGANSGGAVFNQANVTFLDCTFRNNRAVGSSGSSPGGNGGSGSGGAIANSGTLTVERCTFQGNGASGGFGADNPPPDDFTQTTGGAGGTARGAAIFNETGRNLTVRNCTFVGNNAGGASAGSGHHGGTGGSGLGGALCNFGTMTVTGGTCSGNSGFGGSGGLGRFSFTNGAAGRGVGGLAVGGSGTSTVRNTISANNTGNNGGGDVDGVFVSEGYNLIRIGTFSSGINQTGDQVGTAAVPIDALLGALQNNGGPTDTMAVLAGSPARDQGKAFGLSTDQRGQPRPNDNPALPNAIGGDGSEIGAFELSGRTYTVTSTAESALEICDDGDCTLRGAIAAANATPDPDIIRFAPGVTGTILLDGALPTLNRDVAIEGPGANLLTLRRSTGGDYRILTISNGTSVGPTVSVSGLTLANGIATGSFPNNSGGGILNDHGHLTLHRVVVSGNVAASFGGGGGVYNFGANSGSAHLVVSDSTFLTNNGHLGGSAIYNDGNNGGSAFLTLTNSTLSQNAAGFNSATILNAAGGGSATVVATNCTLADSIGSGFANSGAGGSMALRNNLLKAGLFGSANLVLGSGTIVSLGHNLSSDAAGGDGGTGPGGFLNATGDLRNANPQLDPTGAVDHGGPTPTHALLGGSPAINAGNNTFAPPLDQRGFLRAGPSDIGAFEFGGPPLRMTSIQRLANGHVVLQAIGVPGAAHTVERAHGLAAPAFGPLAPATADSSGRIEFTDTTAVDLDRAFYRLTFP